jgi:hypothetical protein
MESVKNLMESKLHLLIKTIIHPKINMIQMKKYKFQKTRKIHLNSIKIINII